MAFTLTGLPRFYNLTKTAWEAGLVVDETTGKNKVEAGAVYFVTEGTETTLYVGKAGNAFLTITDPTVATQITAAIDALRGIHIELSDNYAAEIGDGIKGGTTLEAAIANLHARVNALAGTDGEELDLTSLNAAVNELKAATAGFSSTATVAAGIAAGVEEAKGYTDDEIEKLTIAGLPDYATVITGPLALKANAADVYSKTDADGKFETIEGAAGKYALIGAAYTKAEANELLNKKADADKVYTITDADAKFETIDGAAGKYARIGDAYTKSEADNLLNGKVDKSAYDEQVAKLATKEELNGAKSELQGNIDKKVDQTAYDADKATFALSANVYSKTEADGKFELIGTAYTKGEADGKFATITDVAQDIADAKAAVIGTAEDGASADTVKGAKAYADSLISGLGAVFEFKGVVDNYAALTALTGMEKGDVYLVTSDENQAGTPANAEYVYDGANWELLGNTALDTTNFVQSTVELTADKVVLGNGGKGVKASAYGIGGEASTSAGAANTLATEAAVKTDFDDIIAHLSWKTEM